MTLRVSTTVLLAALALGLQAATFLPADSPQALADFDLQAVDALVNSPFSEAAFKKMAIVVASLIRAAKGADQKSGDEDMAAVHGWVGPFGPNLEETVASLQNQLNVVGNQTALNHAQVTQWVHSNISAIRSELAHAAQYVATKKQLKKGLKGVKKCLEGKISAKVEEEAKAREAADSALEAQIDASINSNSTIPISPLASAVFAADTAVVPASYPSAATVMALLESEIVANITALSQAIQSNYATLAGAIQEFQIGQNNFNATLNSHTAQIGYLNTRQDDLTSYFSNQFLSIQSSMLSNLTSLNQYLSNGVYGKDSTNPQPHFAFTRNVASFSTGRVDSNNPSQILITVPHSVSFANAPAVTVSLLATSGAALPAYTVAVRQVNIASATVVVSLSGGSVSTSDPYSVVVFGFGN